MSVRRAVVEADLASLNVAGFCRDHGISRESFSAWRRRYALEGEAGLEWRSRAPRRVANRTPVEVEDVIVELRKELDDAGLDAGPATIRYWLARRLPTGGEVCSEATIWRVLTRRGFVTPDPSKAPARKWRSFAAARANECWQMDATHWTLADGTEVEIINCLDDCSRLALRTLAVPTATLAGVWDTITDAADRYGWPERVLTDNGRYFGGTFEENLRLLGVGLRHSSPYHPQTCGKTERFQQTEKRWLTAHDPAATIPELQTLLDRFEHIYNRQRPHRSLGRRTPTEVWDTTPKSGPADAPLGRPTSIFRNLVYDGIVWAGPYRITLGVAHNQTRATIVLTGTRTHVFIDGRLIRELTINPDRENQPLHHRPGRPSR
jgi:transposase InsO family protein